MKNATTMEIDFEPTLIQDIQELTAQAIELHIYDRFFEEENMSRDEIFKLVANWAVEFHEAHRNFKWDGIVSYYDEVDKFLTKKDHDYNNPYIDQDGEVWDGESDDHCWPAGGGLHKDCDYNAEALYAYYTIKNGVGIDAYLTKRGFEHTLCDVMGRDVWRKGNTEIDFDAYDYDAHMYGYVHTELI